MFEEILGLPLHALAVHAPVILVPALVLAALAYALVPRVRNQVGWVAVGLALAAPVSVVVAKLSGDAYAEGLYGTRELDPELAVSAHAGFGNLGMWTTIGLGAATAVLAAVRRGTEPDSGLWRAVSWVLAVVVVGLAAMASYYVIRAGHTGAEMIHGGRLGG